MGAAANQGGFQYGNNGYQSGIGNGGAFGGTFGRSGVAPTPFNQPSWGGAYESQFNNATDVFGQSAAGLSGAMNGAFNGLNYNPMQVNAQGYKANLINEKDLKNAQMKAAMMRAPGSYSAAQVDPGAYASQTLQNTDLDSYMNPYTSNVIDTSLADIERARKMQSNMTDAQATSAGAFGGSRQALMQAENNRNFLDQSARTASGLRQSGYQNAQQMALADIGNQNQASQFNLQSDLQGQLANQSATNQASQFNRQMKMTEAMNNQQAQNMARQFNAGNLNQYLFNNQNALNQAGQFNAAQNLQAQGMNQNAVSNANQQRLSASQLLGNLSNLGFGMGQQANGMMGQAGQQMQNINQQLINAAKGQFSGFQGAPQQSMQTLMAALSGAPIPQSQVNSQQMGGMDMLGMMFSMFSDEGLKKNIQKIGKYPGTNHNMYRWEWNEKAEELGINSVQVGVLAQEVMQTQPEVVSRHPENGYLMVNYGGLR